MKSGSRRSWRKLVGLGFAVAAFVFLGLFVARNVEQLREHEWTIRPGLLAASLLLNIVGLGWGVRVWQLLLRWMSCSVGYLSLARVWFLSGLGRYIPGKIWQFVGAAHLGSLAGLDVATVVSSLAVHTGFFLLGALFLSSFLVPAPIGELGGVAVDLVRWGAPLLLLLAHPAVVDGGLRLVRRVSASTGVEWRGRWHHGIGLVLLSAVGWAISGIAFYLFVLSLTPLPPSSIAGIVGINAMAFVAGYIVFIAPAGLGAKETALTGLLAFYVPAPVAALIAVSARLWMVAAEVLPALLLLRSGNGAGLLDAPEREADGSIDR